MHRASFPSKQGLYNPENEKDACGTGFIAKIDGERNHFVIESGLNILINLEHRGAAGDDPKAGDGAGILTQIPHEMFSKELSTIISEPLQEGDYGVGMLFLPPDESARKVCEQIVEQTFQDEGGESIICWRDVPSDNQCLSQRMLSEVPCIRQVFIKNPGQTPEEFERWLFLCRRQMEIKIEALENMPSKRFFYCCSMSSQTIVYKGMFLAFQLKAYYPDLSNPLYKSSVALVHQRYSTNTFPSWSLAQPFRKIAHNGEINTLQGNINWMNARQSQFESHLFGKDIKRLLPVISPGGSDTSTFDNVFEFFCHTGRTVEQTITLMMPEAWEANESLNAQVKGYLEYNSALMEPWDGPAAMLFCDGHKVGASLDRNGLRPLRYCETSNGYFVLGSEAGILDFPSGQIIRKGKLGPGEILMVDMEEASIEYNDEIKYRLAIKHNYREWLAENRVKLSDLAAPPVREQPHYDEIRLRQRVFSYTYEEIHLLIKHMADKGEEAVGSMGTDTPLSILSNKPKLLYTYFKQRFAQVTNPPIDSIREELVMSLRSTIVGNVNVLDETSANCSMLVLDHPILTNQRLEQLRYANIKTFRAVTVDISYDYGQQSLENALEELTAEVERKVDEGFMIIVLSDRAYSENRIPIPALLAVSATHHHLIRCGKRKKIGLILETGEVREVHHFAVLIGYGATAINPYLAFECIDQLRISGHISSDVKKQETPKDEFEPQRNYIKAINKGLKKIFAKMGISTFSSYQGAQIFEAIGLDYDLVEKYFAGTRTAIGGAKLDVIEEEMKQRHQRAYAQEASSFLKLLTGGEYNWRAQGEFHTYGPRSVHYLQQAAQTNSMELYRQFVKEVNENPDQVFSLRGLFKFKNQGVNPVPLEEVEPVEKILKRFTSGAISIGAISREAHETLAIAMNRLGGKSNTGEGGEDEIRFVPDEKGDLKISRIKQVASGRFGVTSHYLVNADEIQIKIAQGAKPGEGGQLPGHKVDDYIAKLRHTIPGVGLISPPPHHDIYSIEDLSQLIFDLRNANRDADISVKLVSSFGIGTVAAGVAKAKADSITIAGFDGGTGATPLSSMKHAGIPWEIGLAETQQTLILNNLRGQVLLEADGQIKTGRDVVIAAMLGADRFGLATASLIAIGCIMMRKCHLNTCPVGIATQNPYLRSKYHGKPEYVQNYLTMVAEDVREIMASLGVTKFEDLIGSMEMLEMNKALLHWKNKGVDISPLLHKPKALDNAYRKVRKAVHDLDSILDMKLIEKCEASLKEGKKTEFDIAIRNLNRTTGTMLGSMISKKYGSKGLPEDTITINFTGSAGQSFGAFLPNGVTLKLSGDANDYVGKGLSGGKIIVLPEESSNLAPDKNVIAGNTTLYGATSGKAFFSGIAGQRFAVRNSGACAVVEGAGDHCCEYMTGGIVVILGDTGKNFGAGMSGGLAYVYDSSQNFSSQCNMAMVDMERLTDQDRINELKDLIEEHVSNTGSPKGKRILSNWRKSLEKFVLVIPLEYRKILVEMGMRKIS